MDDRIKKYILGLGLFVLLPSPLMAAPLWLNATAEPATSTPNTKRPVVDLHTKSRRVSVDLGRLKSALVPATDLSEDSAKKSSTQVQLELPMPNGSQQVFNIVESSIMEPELAARYPQIKTYKAVAKNDSTISGRLDIGPKGFHAYVFLPDGEVFIDPVPESDHQEYYTYYKSDFYNAQSRTFSCGVKSNDPLTELKNTQSSVAARTSVNDKISYKIAVATTGEYSQAVKQTSSVTSSQIRADVLAEIVTAINRINEIYLRDLAIEFTLVSNNDSLIHTNPATDPYFDPRDEARLLDENQVSLDAIVGSANYDVGHLFGTNPGGLAGFSVACVPGYKGRGETGLIDPVGDAFYVDYVAHEIGHQLGAHHTFNGTTGSCAGNRVAVAAYEPGSGSTIMSYAGLCGSESSSISSVAGFHAGSIAEILEYTRLGDGSTCSVAGTASEAPVVSAGQDYTIPGGTPFVLTGSATDVDSASLVFQWDEMDRGAATNAGSYGADNGSNALFRSFAPVQTTVRVLPQLPVLLGTSSDNLADKAETLPTENRTLNFRLTARDGLGGVGEDDMQIVVDGSAGPFKVLQPNTNVVLKSNLSQVIEWNVACTNNVPVSCSNVDILLSTDGGQTFASIVGGSTPNDGSQMVVLPTGDTTTARIKIVCTDNIFFDISDVDFQINDATGGSITSMGLAQECGTAMGGLMNDDVEPNNFPEQAQNFVLPSSLRGTVNDIEDPDDYFILVGNDSTYKFTLSDYGNSDLDIILLDSTGNTIVAISDSESNPTEVITKKLTEGVTYYLLVQGWYTGGVTSDYTLTASIVTDEDSGTLSAYWLFILLITILFRTKPHCALKGE